MEHNKIKINCPKCGKETEFTLMYDAMDEEGEVYKCNHCGFHFRYALK